MKPQKIKRKFDYVNHIYVKTTKNYYEQINRITLHFLLKYRNKIKRYTFTIPNSKSCYNDIHYRLLYNFPKRKFFKPLKYERRYD